MANDMASRNHLAGVIMFYVVFIVLLVFEGLLVGFILKIADKLHIHAWGPWIAWVLFIAGASLLAMIELRTTEAGHRMRDPILRFCCWLQRKYGGVGYLVNTIVFAPVATAVALKQTDHPAKEKLSFLSAFLWSTIFVLVLTLIWRS